jgi:hypothetical protein
VTCERCAKPIEPGAEEMCGVCCRPLCLDCWEAFGYGPDHTRAEHDATWKRPAADPFPA